MSGSSRNSHKVTTQSLVLSLLRDPQVVPLPFGFDYLLKLSLLSTLFFSLGTLAVPRPQKNHWSRYKMKDIEAIECGELCTLSFSFHYLLIVFFLYHQFDITEICLRRIYKHSWFLTYRSGQFVHSFHTNNCPSGQPSLEWLSQLAYRSVWSIRYCVLSVQIRQSCTWLRLLLQTDYTFTVDSLFSYRNRECRRACSVAHFEFF